jgi:HTH-type transcriptional regulator/antitoxin HipB
MNDYSIKTTQQLGSVLPGYRKDRKLTQRAVGEKVGFAQNVVSMMESDPGQVSLSRLFKLLSALDLELVVRRKTTVSKSEW